MWPSPPPPDAAAALPAELETAAAAYLANLGETLTQDYQRDMLAAATAAATKEAPDA